MDNCSVEIIVLIVEYACADDLGKTARCIGLVSKFFRSVAEPIELRTIQICGLNQLRSAIERLGQASSSKVRDGSDGTVLDVRNLFISEMTQEHALATQAYGRPFWRSRSGIEAEHYYHQHASCFWDLAASLVEKASSRLKTLSLHSATAFRLLSYQRPPFPTVLRALSDVSFPHLIALTVNHYLIQEMLWAGYEAREFQSPLAPSLHHLHIISPISLKLDEDKRLVHPLLTDMPFAFPELTHLSVSFDGVKKLDNVLQSVFGEDWKALERTHALPRKLQSVVLSQGNIPHFHCGTSLRRYRHRSREIIEDAERIGIDGLKVQPPLPQFPEAGKRKFEALVSEWQEQCMRLWCAS